jgi:transposase
LPDADTREIAALCQRHQQLLEMQQMETNRFERAERATRKSIKAVPRFSQRELEQVEQEIERSIKNSPIWQAKSELLASMKRIGAASCSALLAWLPELGHFSRQKICALVGVAPYEDQSWALRPASRAIARNPSSFSS